MIRLFRKIRQQLLSQSNYGIYILYAAGEIILVVIGILIALQIDNRNDWRKLRDLEISTLEELVTTLEQDTTLLSKGIFSAIESEKAGSLVITALEERIPYDQSLSYNLSRAYRSNTADPIDVTAFDLLKERGTDIISNKLIRRAITKHYTIYYKELKRSIDQLNRIHLIEAQSIYGHFKYMNDNEGNMILIPDSMEDIYSNRMIINAFYHFRQMAQRQQARLINHYDFTANLLQTTKEEILRLKKN